jgi:cytochrome bd ubiquinol oxidase subunit I
MDTFVLARAQFAANMSFHILFPTISIALAWLLVFFKVRQRRAKQPLVWQALYGFWVKVFALCFALGVTSGITMSFQFGTNWPGFMKTVGNVAGPLLAYEVMTAFFLEASFLGVMLFGQSRVSARVHTAATLLVAIGTTLSAFWILALNSWMHTPAGYVLNQTVNGPSVEVLSWWAVIFNPSFPYRLSHMLCASVLTVAFLVIGISSYRMLKKDLRPEAKMGLVVGLVIAAVTAPLQMVLGDLHGLNTRAHQPAKIAAIEAVWETGKGVPLTLFGIPDERTRSTHWAIEVPKIASLVLTHELNGEIKGLNEFAQHPPVKPLFFGFRVMVGTGVAMLGCAWFGMLLIWRKRELPTWFLRILVGMTFAGWIAVLSGWYVTEIGRQPWLVTGILTAAQAASGMVNSHQIGMSLSLYLSMYALLLTAFIRTLFYLAKNAVVGELPQLDIAQSDTKLGAQTAAIR